MTQELIKSISIESMLANKKAAMDNIKQALELLNKAQDYTRAFGMGTINSWLIDEYGRYHPMLESEPLKAIEREIDRSGWQHLMKESGLTTFMDAKRRDEWSKTIREGKEIPPMNKNNIFATFDELHNNRGTMFEDGVENIFKRLSWEYKTNCPCFFGKIIIMNGMVSYNKKWGFSSSYSSRGNELYDLERAMRLLDNLPELDHRSSITQLFADAVNGKEQTIHTDYFYLKWYQKGSLHVTFKRLDLVEKMNQIIVKRYPGALPARTK